MASTRTLTVDVGGKPYSITSDENDRYLDHIRNGFEPELVHLLRTVGKNSQVALDIGANIGCTTLLLADLARHVHAFEPSPTTFRFLEQNVVRARLPNVFLHNIGLGSEAGEFSLSVADDNRSGGFVSNVIKPGAMHSSEQIQIQTVDRWAAARDVSGIDFIKIDVEGFEGHVLRGAQDSLAKEQPIVVLELNHWCLNAFQRTSIPDFFDFLKSIFPVLYAVDGSKYLDLHIDDDALVVMYYHILQMRFPNIVAAFDKDQLCDFRAAFEHRFEPEQNSGSAQVQGALSRMRRVWERVFPKRG